MSQIAPYLLALQQPSLFKTQSLINGEWVNGSTQFDVLDPATGQRLAQVANMGATETEQAISAANAAWPAWRQLPAKARANILMRWFHLLHEHADDLARIMTAEQGKPLAEAKGEVGYGASFIEWFAEEARRVYGETVPSTNTSQRIMVIKQPIGVCAAITPWNFPIAMITRKVAPALAAGCPVVIKPAEATPLCALALAELAQRAGMPPGVFNVITADADQSVAVGKALCASDTVRHLSFTGSTEVGRLLMQQCAPTVKKLSLELGGNAPFIVFDDADVDAAVAGALISKYRNAGQTCVCANRLLVQAGIHDAFVEKLTAEVAKMQVGNGFTSGVTQGPLIDAAALEKVETLLRDAVDQGARIKTGGQRIAATEGSGAFFQPTVLTGANSKMRVAKEEIFGPVAPIFKFSTEQEAIAMANDTEFGLASYLYSRDIGRIFRVSEALEYGMVGVNTGLVSTCEAPFGGVKQSGLGREGSRHGLEDYVEMKYLCLGGMDA